MTANTPALPLELIQLISEHCGLDTQTWGSLRLTCHAIEAAIRPIWPQEHFSIRSLCVSGGRLEGSLPQMADTPDLVGKVRKLLIRCKDEGWGPTIVNSNNPSRPAPPVLELAKVFSKLPQLDIIEFCPYAKPLAVNPTTEDTTPCVHISKAFNLVTLALEHARNRPRAISFTLSYLTSREVGIDDCRVLPYLHRTLSAVESLHLQLFLSMYGSAHHNRASLTYKTLAQALGSMSRTLQQLRLSTLPRTHGMEDVFAALAKVTFPRLTVVELIGLRMYAGDVATFIRNHCVTLSALNMIHFGLTIQGDEIGDVKNVLRDMQSCEPLDLLTLSGLVTNTGFLRFPGVEDPEDHDLGDEEDTDWVEVVVGCLPITITLRSYDNVRGVLPRMIDGVKYW